MTLEEESDLLILNQLLTTKGKLLTRDEYFNLTKDITGNSFEYIKNSLLKKGYLDEGNYPNDEMPNHLPLTHRIVYKIFVTDIGIKAYYDLKKKQKNEFIQKIAFWTLFVASIVSAIYAVLTYYADASTKSQQLQTPTLMTKPIKVDTSKKVKQTAQHDTTNQKKTVSYKIDATKK